MLKHREFITDEFWKAIPAWKDITEEQFADHKWQSKNSVRKVSQVKDVLKDRVSDAFIEDIEAGMKLAPMNVRITPYVFALIDWDNPEADPLRKQFLPIASQHLPDHPMYMVDSLHEDVDSPVPMLTHRYQDKVLFLPLTTCPVYCSYCTRSRIIGGSTDIMDKSTYGPKPESWEQAFQYLREHPEIEDVVISGGDAYNLPAKYIKLIGETLLNIPHIRRIRYATKGIAIMPMKILTDDAWFNAIKEVRDLAVSMDKQAVIHTHFSSPNEVTEWSRQAASKLFQAGILVRNQGVLQAGINNSEEQMILLTKQLSYLNIQPYYIYLHDMIQGCEHLRTSLEEGVELEKALRGTTAGFNTPTFVCDAPGGGGKRHIASYEHYNKETGISVWKAPNVKPGEVFTYFDPLHTLSEDAQKRWADKDERQKMIGDAVEAVTGKRPKRKLSVL